MIRFHFGGEDIPSAPPDDGGEWVVDAYAQGIKATLLAAATATAMAFSAGAQARKAHDELGSTPPVQLDSAATYATVAPAQASLRYWFQSDDVVLAPPTVEDDVPVVAPILWPTPRAPQIAWSDDELAVVRDDDEWKAPVQWPVARAPIALVDDSDLSIAPPIADDDVGVTPRIVWPTPRPLPVVQGEDEIPTAAEAPVQLDSVTLVPVVAPSTRTVRYLGGGDELPTATPIVDEDGWVPPRPQRSDDVVSLFISDEDLQLVVPSEQDWIPRAIWPAPATPRAIAIADELPTAATAIDDTPFVRSITWPTPHAIAISAVDDVIPAPTIADDEAWPAWLQRTQQTQRVVSAFHATDELPFGTITVDEDGYCPRIVWSTPRPTFVGTGIGAADAIEIVTRIVALLAQLEELDTTPIVEVLEDTPRIESIDTAPIVEVDE